MPNRKKDAFMLAIVAGIVSVVQGAVVAYVHHLPTGDAPEIQSLWSEVRILGGKIEEIGKNVAALQEDAKQDARRDDALHELDKQVMDIAKHQAGDEAELKAKGQ